MIEGYPEEGSNLEGSSFVTWEADPALSNERILTAGNNVTFSNDGTNLTINAQATGGGAPTTASYVTISTEPSLSAERRLAEGNAITITDNGPNSTVDIGVSSTLLGLSFLTVSNETLLTGERSLAVSSPLEKVDNGANSTLLLRMASATPTTVLAASGESWSAQFGAFIGSKSWSGGGTNVLTSSSESLNAVNATAGTTTFDLPLPGLCQSKLFNFKKTDSSANTVIINAGSSTIDGSTTFTIYARYQSVQIYSNGAEWLII